ncbi:hypothetical protein Ple7327_2920 [Pleurocapsa sp. PCC 7327]|jgi:hypothetical protein|nr:hypothetical protein Ple7327_2920 [Pleurocapsa sp. PCC 7327]
MKLSQNSHLANSIGWLLVLALTSIGVVLLMALELGVS